MSDGRYYFVDADDGPLVHLANTVYTWASTTAASSPLVAEVLAEHTTLTLKCVDRRR